MPLTRAERSFLNMISLSLSLSTHFNKKSSRKEKNPFVSKKDVFRFLFQRSFPKAVINDAQCNKEVGANECRTTSGRAAASNGWLDRLATPRSSHTHWLLVYFPCSMNAQSSRSLNKTNKPLFI